MCLIVKISGACFLSKSGARRRKSEKRREEKRRALQKGSKWIDVWESKTNCDVSESSAMSLLLPAAKITECPDKTQWHNVDNRGPKRRGRETICKFSAEHIERASTRGWENKSNRTVCASVFKYSRHCLVK